MSNWRWIGNCDDVDKVAAAGDNQLPRLPLDLYSIHQNLELILENGGLLIVHMEKGEHMMLL